MKKGDSQAVAWVLLLGLSISLAILVGVWIKNTSKTASENVIEGAIQEQRCADTVLYVNHSCVTNQIQDIVAKNNGAFSIVKVKCSNEGGTVVDGVFGIGVILEPGKSKVLNNCMGNTLNIIPVIDIDGVNVTCGEKRVRINC